MAEAVRYERDREGIVTLTLDQPGAAVNVMNDGYRASMGTAITRLESELADVRGVVVRSAKSSFFAGGDLAMLAAVTSETAHELDAFIADVKDQLRRLERCGKPVVALVAGSALGGGLEIALACHHRIVMDAVGVKVGLPEVTLGLLPGAGGVTRLVRLLGLDAALPLLLEGTQLSPSEAYARGIADELVADGNEADARAREWIAANPGADQPWDRRGAGVPGFRLGDPELPGRLAAASAMVHAKTRGTYPAPERVLAAAVEGAHVDVDTAFAIEGRYFRSLATDPVATNMIETLWFGRNEVVRGASRPQGPKPREIASIGVLGGGFMGAGIAQVAAYSGLDVVLVDVSADRVRSGRDRIGALLQERVDKGRLGPDRRDAILASVRGTTRVADLAGCDLVVEAVFEDRAVKSEVLADAASVIGPDAVLVSNTSTLPITGLARAVRDPARFAGLHFFSPVEKMPLVEVIRGRETSDATVARAFDLGRQLGKVPIIVRDGRGFFTSRVFGSYLTEGVALLAEGVPPALIENVARRAGMPVGPLAVGDEVGLSLVAGIREQEIADRAAEGEEPEPHPAYEVITAMVREYGRAGRSVGAGFYDYPDQEPKRLWPELTRRFARGAGGVPEDDVTDRLLYIQALETYACLAEGIVGSERDADVGSVLGVGFPAWTGGAARFVRTVGTERFAERAAELAGRYGRRFDPDAMRQAGGLDMAISSG